jgi:hypothetical protein
VGKAVTAPGTKRLRRTKGELAALDEQLYAIITDALAAGLRRVTVRQVFYLAVGHGLVPKAEAQGYRRVQARLVELRKQGVVPWEWVVDNTRWRLKPASYAGLTVALDDLRIRYRRSVWEPQDCYVEIWTEKDAIAGLLSDATQEWDVPVVVCRGFSSLSFLHDEAALLSAQRKPVHLYYFGDYDPSGQVIPQAVERTLREFAPEADMHFRVAAVTPAQITRWGLLKRPTKRVGNPHAKRFVSDESVEVDAIPPPQLRQLVRSCVERHLDTENLAVLLEVEDAERESLSSLVEEFRS